MYVCSFVSETFNLLNSNSVPSQILILCVPLNTNSSPPELNIMTLVVIYCWSLRPNVHIKRSYPFESPPKLAVSLSHVILTSFFAAVFYFTLQFATNPMIWRLFYAKARKCLRVKKTPNSKPNKWVEDGMNH